MAITLTETGRGQQGRTEPWPWTVNMEGKGLWFDDRDQALSYAYRHFKKGARSFDVGCFQLNFKWHGENFTSIDEMFDPLANARYAAKFLSALYSEFGDWSRAAGAYHSRTQVHATRYRKKFDQFRSRVASMDPSPEVFAPVTTRERRISSNSYPLLQGGGAGSVGSLVPMNGAPRPFIDRVVR